MPGRENPKRQDLIDFLLEPSSYPHNPGTVTHIQTHISDVFIAAPFVYKVKKPVDLGFLDFSTLEKRKMFCRTEVELNRRLCPGVYLGVEEITSRDGVLTLGGSGEIVEYAVKIKELPESGFLHEKLGRGEVREDDIRRLSRRLVDFYRSQPVREEVSAYGLPERIRINIDENLSLSREFVGTTITRQAYCAISYYNEKYFTDKRAIFLKRVEDGFIKDCHGDLHLDHVNINPDGICIYDCIEFSDRLRYIDTASDLAFLAMDLDYNGRPDLARLFISETAGLTGDEGIYRVLDFYKCYRAFVRGKVESIKALEPEVPADEKELSKRRAEKYFRLALRYALFGSTPAVIVTFGIIGTGKSTLAGMLGGELSCRVVSSDAVRKEITGTPAGERRYEGWEGGIYTSDTTERTYKEIIGRALDAARSDMTAVLDASFSKRKWREMLLSEAWEAGVSVFFVRTTAPVEEVELRLLRREVEGTSVSDARAAILPRFLAEWEEPDEWETAPMFKVNTSKPGEAALDTLMRDIIDEGLSRIKS
ncbi:MAG TPA: AAA family ATPase [Thermodesulfobacteriota bacterium]|nr:AAA family ATPase [Thermodesulfobacteriota bacterium]